MSSPTGLGSRENIQKKMKLRDPFDPGRLRGATFMTKQVFNKSGFITCFEYQLTTSSPKPADAGERVILSWRLHEVANHSIDSGINRGFGAKAEY